MVFENISSDKTLKRIYHNEDDIIKKQNLGISLLIILLQKNKFQTTETAGMLDDLISFTREIENYLYNNYKKETNNPNKMLLDIFYNNTIYKIFQIESIYRDINYISEADRLQVLRKDLEKNYALFEGDKTKYIYLYIHKITSQYGTSFRQLGLITIIITLIFGSLFYTLEAANLLGLKGFADMETAFYYYASLVTMTNVGSDFGIDSGNILLRVLLSIEQILGAILFGIFVMLVAKRL